MRPIFHLFIVIAVLVAPCISLPAESPAQSANLVQSKDNSMRAIATKVAEFEEDFAVGGIDFSADGLQVATNAMFAGLDVHIWQWQRKSHIVNVYHKTAPAGEGNAIRFNIDGSLLAVGHAADTRANGLGIVGIWDTRSGALVHEIAEPNGASDTMSFSFLPDGKSFLRTVDHGNKPGDYLVMHSIDSWAVKWGLSTLPLIPRSLAVRPDGGMAAVGGQVFGPPPGFPLSPQVAIVDLHTHRIVRTINNVFPDENQVQALAWSADGQLITAGCIVDGSFRGPKAVRVFDSATGAEVAYELADTAFVSGLVFTANNQYLVEGQVDHGVRIWDSRHKSLLQTLPVTEHVRSMLSVSRDSRYLAIASGTHVSIWELN